MVQYLHFRILEFPLTIFKNIYHSKNVCPILGGCSRSYPMAHGCVSTNQMNKLRSAITIAKRKAGCWLATCYSVFGHMNWLKTCFWMGFFWLVIELPLFSETSNFGRSQNLPPAVENTHQTCQLWCPKQRHCLMFITRTLSS